MDVCGNSYTSETSSEQEMEFNRGPWTIEEDMKLGSYISKHGEGRWNWLARCAGLKRTGKSCRLRWLNYLRPDLRRGNISLQEQLLILELHSIWGNRWSKIAQYLPGRTDNEIKNYWRTRVQKQAKQLRCDVNSKIFRDTLRYQWIPRLVEKIQAAKSDVGTHSNMHQVAPSATSESFSSSPNSLNPSPVYDRASNQYLTAPSTAFAVESTMSHKPEYSFSENSSNPFLNSRPDSATADCCLPIPYTESRDDYSSTINSSDSFITRRNVSPVYNLSPDHLLAAQASDLVVESMPSDDLFALTSHHVQEPLDLTVTEGKGESRGDISDILCNLEDIWRLEQQLWGDL